MNYLRMVSKYLAAPSLSIYLMLTAYDDVKHIYKIQVRILFNLLQRNLRAIVFLLRSFVYIEVTFITKLDADTKRQDFTFDSAHSTVALVQVQHSSIWIGRLLVNKIGERRKKKQPANRAQIKTETSYC